MTTGEERWGVWMTIEHWASVDGGHDWVGTREQANERARGWAAEPIPAGVRYEARPYTGTEPDASSSRTLTKTTVLDGYYASGRYDDGFAFDTHPPDYDHGADLREWMKAHYDVDDAPEELFHTGCHVFPTALLPDETKHRKGRWTVTVTFEPVE